MTTKTIKEMRERHKKEIEKFQSQCSHPESSWMLQEWALGHYTGYEARVCEVCEKVLEKRQLPGYPDKIDHLAYFGLSKEKLEKLIGKL